MRIRILLAALCLLLLSGCYDYRETDSIAIVSGLHVAQGGEKNYKLTFEIVGTKSGDRSPKTQVTGKEGDTIADAIDNATAVSGKKLYFGHAQVLAVDFALAQQGISEVLDYFTRQNDMPLSMDVLVTKGITGEELFKSEEEDVRSFVLADMLKANEERAITPEIELYTFVADSFEEGKDSYLPVVKMGKDGKMSLASAVVFKDAALTGELNEEDTKYLMLLENIGNKGGFILEREEGSPVSFEIRSRKADIKPYLEQGRLIVDVDFNAQFGVLELIGDAAVLKEEKLTEMENELEKYVFEQFHGALDKMSRNNSADVLGIERSLIRSNPKLADFLVEDFPELYKNAHFNVTADLSVIDSGRTLRRLVKLR